MMVDIGKPGETLCLAQAEFILPMLLLRASGFTKGRTGSTMKLDGYRAIAASPKPVWMFSWRRTHARIRIQCRAFPLVPRRRCCNTSCP